MHEGQDKQPNANTYRPTSTQMPMEGSMYCASNSQRPTEITNVIIFCLATDKCRVNTEMMAVGKWLIHWTKVCM